MSNESTESRVGRLEADVGRLTDDIKELTDSLKEWSAKVESKLDAIDGKVGSVGTISSKAVFNGTIALIGALQIVFGAAVGAGVIYVNLKTKPMNDLILEEIRDRKATDVIVTQNSSDIKALQSDMNGIRVYQDATSQMNNWFNFYHQGQIDALKSIEMQRKP